MSSEMGLAGGLVTHGLLGLAGAQCSLCLPPQYATYDQVAEVVGPVPGWLQLAPLAEAYAFLMALRLAGT
eukprot:8225072-Prorocentrum_lima.AAC.1